MAVHNNLTASTCEDRITPSAIHPSAVEVVYVGGHGRHASSLLGHLLSERSGAMDGGELAHLFEWAAQGRVCACELPLPDCPFWGPVIACVEKDTGMSMATLAVACEDAEQGKKSSSIWSQAWGATISELHDLHGVQRIVDSSRTVQRRKRIELLSSLQKVRICLLVQVRRSIALRHSKRGRDTSVSDGSKLSGLGVVAATEAIAHRTRIDRVAALQGARVPHQRVGHDALVHDADRTIEALAAAAGWTAPAADPTGGTLREMAQDHAIGTRRHSVHH